MDDAALAAAAPDANGRDAVSLVDELVRRRLPLVVTVLEALCRRFKGFGVHSMVSEQIAVLNGLRLLGGAEAAAAVARIIVEGIVQGPGLVTAAEAGAALGVRLPPEVALPLLRHAEPRLRSAACCCARPTADVVTVLLDLLTDLHDSVADAAALALARIGRGEARPRLVALLMRAPSPEVIEAFVSIADDDGLVLLGRLASDHPDLADDILEALEDAEGERAQVVSNSIRRRLQR